MLFAYTPVTILTPATWSSNLYWGHDKRGSVKLLRGDLDGAMSDYNQAIKLKCMP